MATHMPDSRTMKSWNEAFQYPIPTVRKVEQELRRDIASNREKLRSLVGTRYRELLGTAETIIEMNGESAEVEAKLASIGFRCNTSLIGKKSINLTDINREPTGKTEGDRALAGQLALLHRCSTVAGRLLRKHDSPLLASKLMVISRLLYKTISQASKAPPFLETLRSQLSSLQKLIRRRINRILGSANSSGEVIIDSMAAYCLSNNASSLDVITHFHNIRLSYIGKRMERGENASECIPRALSLYVQTLQHTKVLFSRRLSEALAKLQAQPLLNDSDIRNLDDIDLDILGRWVVTDVKNFTPWIKYDDLTKQSAEKILKTWSQKAFNDFLKRGGAVLKDAKDFAELLSIRKTTLDIWLSAKTTTVTHSSTSILDGIRTLFNAQLKSILLHQARELVSIGDAVKLHVEHWQQDKESETQSLWDSNLTSLEVSEGAALFKRVLTETLLGQDSRIVEILEAYNSWLATIESSRRSIDDLRHTRWEDTLDDDEADDEEFHSSSVDLLTQDDPYELREAQKAAVRQALVNLQDYFSDVIDVFGKSDNSRKAAFILRLIRDLRRGSPSDILQDDSLDFAQDIVLILQETLAEEVLARVPASKILPLSKHNLSRVPGRTLWDKSPELPIQPLPSTFQYFRRLVEAMEDLGPDLWNPSAVAVLKKIVHENAASALSAKLGKLKYTNQQTEEAKEHKEEDLTTSDRHKEPSSSTSTERDHSKITDIVRDWKIQLLLDAFYIRDVLSVPSEENDPLNKFIETLQGETEDEDGIVGTLQESAHEFWKRTELLFGLLAT